MELRNRYKQGLRDGIPIALGYLSVSFAFGLSAARGGLPVWMAVVISMTNLTSAGQVAGLCDEIRPLRVIFEDMMRASSARLRALTEE